MLKIQIIYKEHKSSFSDKRLKKIKKMIVFRTNKIFHIWNLYFECKSGFSLKNYKLYKYGSNDELTTL